MKNKITRYLLKVHLIKSCKTIHQIFYFILFYISFYISRHHFSQILRTSFNNYLKKRFLSQFFLCDTHHHLFFSCCFSLVRSSADFIFHNFLQLHSKLSEKRFSSQIFIFLLDSLKPAHPLKDKNLLNVTNFVAVVDAP